MHFSEQRTTRVSALVAIGTGLGFWALALRRFATFHNETFDLAFYARWVWGLAHGDRYQPLTNSDIRGLHASPILALLGWLARLVPTVELLLFVQALCVALALVPLARLAARRLRTPLAALVCALAFVLYPTVGILATYEFHPSALALLPFALALDALDQQRLRSALVALGLAALCREDAALTAGFVGLAMALDRRGDRAHRRAGLAVFAAGLAWFVTYFFVVAPKYLPRHGSLEAHFSQFGTTPKAILSRLVSEPLSVLRHFATPVRLLYLPRLVAPLAFLPLFSPRVLIPIVVAVGINLLSSFPSAPQVSSHYATLVVPFVFVAAVYALESLVSRLATPRTRNRALALAALLVTIASLVSQHRAGFSPLSRRWNPAVFHDDARARDLRALLALVPPRASIAAPDYVLPHVAERAVLQRMPPRLTVDWALVPTTHRARFTGSQDLWRSSEETLSRNYLADPSTGLVAATDTHLLFLRGFDPRAYARGRYVFFSPQPSMVRQHEDIGPSAALAAWRLDDRDPDSTRLTLVLVARQRWPHDFAVELGWGPMHPHADREDPARLYAALLFDGRFSPTHVHRGELARTELTLPASRDALLSGGLYLGLRRVDGSRLDADAPHWVRLRPDSQR